MMKRNFRLLPEKETPGTFRYREVNSSGAYIHGDREGALIGDIYVSKVAMVGKPPDKITVTIAELSA